MSNTPPDPDQEFLNWWLLVAALILALIIWAAVLPGLK